MGLMIVCQCAGSAIPAGQACGPRTTPGVASGVGVLFPTLPAVLCGVGVLPVLPAPLLQAAKRGIRKSITRRLPVNRRLACGEEVCIMICPSIARDRHAYKDSIEELF